MGILERLLFRLFGRNASIGGNAELTTKDPSSNDVVSNDETMENIACGIDRGIGNLGNYFLKIFFHFIEFGV